MFHLYVIQSPHRDDIKTALTAQDIIPGIHYLMGAHMNPGYRDKVRLSSNLDVTEGLLPHILSLPIYPEIDFDHVEKIIQIITNADSKTSR